MYKLTVEIYAEKILDLEQLLCAIAEEILDGTVTGSGGGRLGRYTFNLEKPAQCPECGYIFKGQTGEYCLVCGPPQTDEDACEPEIRMVVAAWLQAITKEGNDNTKRALENGD